MDRYKSFLLSIEAPNGWINSELKVRDHLTLDQTVDFAYGFIESKFAGARFQLWEPAPFGVQNKLLYDSAPSPVMTEAVEDVIEAFMDGKHISGCKHCGRTILPDDMQWENYEDKQGEFFTVVRFICPTCHHPVFVAAERGLVDHPVQFMERYK